MLKKISIDGGLEAHDKKVALQAFSDFLDLRPTLAGYKSILLLEYMLPERMVKHA